MQPGMAYQAAVLLKIDLFGAGEMAPWTQFQFPAPAWPLTTARGS